MSTQRQKMQEMIRRYKAETGETDVNLRSVASWMVQHGWRAPSPITPIDRLAKELAIAAREEMRHDEVTGQPYRANHAMVVHHRDGAQLSFWIDIDDAATTRGKISLSLGQRREQMVGDAVQLTLDANHWNRSHPTEKAIKPEMDFTDDVEWRLNAPAEQSGVG